MSLENELVNINGKILIYGAHLVALECCRFLVAHGKGDCIVGFAVTDSRENPAELEGLQVKEISGYEEECRTATVVIAMPKKFHAAAEACAREKGFGEFIKVSLEELSRLKGRRLLLELRENPGYPFVLEENVHDGSWMDIREAKGERNTYYKFPTLFYRDIKDVLQETRKHDLQKEYRETLGHYRNLHTIKADSRKAAEKSAADAMKVYMAFSKGDSAKISREAYEPWICPLQLGGRDVEMEFPHLYDDVGESIADKNHIFSEMTGAYWIWKNVNGAAYKGLCHYRRHFVISEEEIGEMERNGIEVILTTPRYVPYGVGNMFLAETPVKRKVFEILFRAVHECAEGDEENFRDYMDACFYYPNNLVIAQNDIYDDYCEWIFKILFRMLDIDMETGYGHADDRHIAYSAELLTSYYFAGNRDKYCIAVTDYQFYV